MTQPRWLPGCFLVVAGIVTGATVVALGTAGEPMQEAGKAVRRWTPQEHTPPPAPGVIVRTLATTDVRDTVVAWGRLVPERRARLAFRTGGRLTKRFVVGMTVRRGDVVATLDATVASASVAETKALLAKAIADLARLDKLAEHTAAADREAAVAQVAVRTAMLTRARDLLAAHQLVAPFDGVVSRAGAEVGTESAPGVPVVTVDQVDPIRLELPLAPHRVPTLRRGMPVAVVVDGLTGAAEAGFLARIPPTARVRDGLFVCEVLIPNAIGRLRAGYIARGVIERGRFRDVIVLPRSAVEEGPGGRVRLALVDNDTIRTVELRAPIRLDDRVLVHDPALVGKLAVIAGPRPLADGTVVRPFAEGSAGATRLAAGGQR